MCILCSPPGSRPEIPPPGREGHLPVAQSGEGARKLARWQPTCGVDLQTKDAVYTLSAMTSGIRRNWIEALRKTVRPTSAPDVTKYVLGWTGAFGEALTIPPALHPEWVSSARLRALGLSFSANKIGRWGRGQWVSVSLIQKYLEVWRLTHPTLKGWGEASALWRSAAESKGL